MTSYGGLMNHLFCENTSESNFSLISNNIPKKFHKMATLFSLNEEVWSPAAISM